MILCKISTDMNSLALGMLLHAKTIFRNNASTVLLTAALVLLHDVEASYNHLFGSRIEVVGTSALNILSKSSLTIRGLLLSSLS